MFSYCLKRKIILKVLIAKFLQLAMVKKRYYQSVLYVVLKNQHLLKNKKQNDY